LFLMEFDRMKRIALIIAGLLLLVANTAEARRGRNYSQPTYSQPVYAQPVYTQQKPVLPATAPAPAAKAVKVAPVAHTTAAKTTAVTTTAAAKTTTAAKTVSTSFSTTTAQGVANIMASRGVVGHFGGNPGYEGCGMASTPEGAYSICCYGNSGMATVDVGYAQGANGMWYCCRRYR
jgi:hypothetical protein